MCVNIVITNLLCENQNEGYKKYKIALCNLNFLVQVLPEGRLGEMISFEFHLEKRHEKTQKPLWFLGLPNRYLFRFAMLVGSAGLDGRLTGSNSASVLQPGLRCPIFSSAGKTALKI